MPRVVGQADLAAGQSLVQPSDRVMDLGPQIIDRRPLVVGHWADNRLGTSPAENHPTSQTNTQTLGTLGTLGTLEKMSRAKPSRGRGRTSQENAFVLSISGSLASRPLAPTGLLLFPLRNASRAC